GSQPRVVARDVGRATHQETVSTVLDQVVAPRVDHAGAVWRLAAHIDIVGDDRVAYADEGSHACEATSIADPIPVGIRRIAGRRHVVQTYRARVRRNTTPVRSRRIAADRAARDGAAAAQRQIERLLKRTADQDTAAVPLREIVAHDGVRDREGGCNRYTAAVQHSRIPADGAAMDGEGGGGGRGLADAAA